MRRILIVAWLFVPAAALAYHYGPGQKGLVLDEAAAILAEADRHAASQEWLQAIEKYDQALELLPDEEVNQVRHIHLARCKAQMYVAQLPSANRALEQLLADVSADEEADPKLVAETRAAVAESQYYMTWLLRLEGASREEWGPYIEGARQNYRLLAENAGKAGDETGCDQAKKDLDSSIRLARMDLSDLQALPLPSQ